MTRDDEWLLPHEAAALLGVSPSTLRRMESRGDIPPARRLPGSKHRRWRRRVIEALVDNGDAAAKRED